jgi:hypothetical protein
MARRLLRFPAVPTYVVDCGHGGNVAAQRSTPHGARGPSGLLEKEVTLRLGARVAHLLGPSALLTRADDRNLSLGARADVARRTDADVFLSLHADGQGTWVHRRAGAGSMTLARSIDRALARFGGSESGGGVRASDLAVLTPERLGARTAACLVEVGDVSSRDGERRLRDPAALDALARAIVYGAQESVVGGALQASALDNPEQLSTGPINFNNPHPYRDHNEASGNSFQYINFHIPPRSGRSTVRIVGTYDTNGFAHAVTFDVALVAERTADRYPRSMTLPAGSSGNFDFNWTNVARDSDYFIALSVRDTACHLTGRYTVTVA